jgi:hypothetical protein
VSDDHHAFDAAVSSAFRYLVDSHGFTRHPMQLLGRERVVEYEKPNVTVRVQQEIGSAPDVTLLAPKSIAPGLRRHFGLHELEQEMEKTNRYKPVPVAPVSLQDSVNALAIRLSLIGSDVLAGDFALLFARLQRHVDAAGLSSA